MKPPPQNQEAIAWLEDPNQPDWHGCHIRAMFDVFVDVKNLCLAAERMGRDCGHGKRHRISKPITEEDLDYWVATGAVEAL